MPDYSVNIEALTEAPTEKGGSATLEVKLGIVIEAKDAIAAADLGKQFISKSLTVVNHIEVLRLDIIPLDER